MPMIDLGLKIVAPGEHDLVPWGEVVNDFRESLEKACWLNACARQRFRNEETMKSVVDGQPSAVFVCHFLPMPWFEIYM